MSAMQEPAPTAAPGEDPRPTRTLLLPLFERAAPQLPLRRLAPLLTGHRLVVLAPWRSVAPAAGLARAALPASMVAVGVARIDGERRAAAERAAAEAAAIAGEHGVEAATRVERLDGAWHLLVTAVALDEGVDAVLVDRPRPALRRRLRRADGDALLLAVA